MFGQEFQNKTVWLTGATGFKGSWLAEWLLLLGARVHGFSLEPDPGPSLFNQLRLSERIENEIQDIRDPAGVLRSLKQVQPDFVFHLAAQPLVRFSYEQPLETYAINVMGTVNVLNALRTLEKPCAAVFVTTDKCYENREWVHGYREEDPLGGFDPYSSSKAAAEMAISAWRRSFFAGHPVRIASARAGNVIGGGDWAKDRIVPDCMRALQLEQSIPVRNKTATRPWQHVLEPLSGYLWLAAIMANPGLTRFEAAWFASAFNFGPGHDSNRSVAGLVEEILKHWPGRWQDQADPQPVHEATLLQLATDKAHAFLDWSPIWDFSESIAQTVQWYRAVMADPEPEHPHELTVRQIQSYSRCATERRMAWAVSR